MRKAEEDFEAAESLHAARLSPSAVCFHAQQYMEKYIKAYLVRSRVHFPRTHELNELLDLLAPLLPGVRVLRPAGKRLDPYAIRARYPGPQEVVPRPATAVRDMNTVRDIMRRAMGLRPRPFRRGRGP